jgi:hypothetical protein
MSNTTKQTNSARGEDCTIRLEYVCNHNTETTVAAHVNGIRFGHGTGKKTEFFAYACSACHDVVDGRVKRPKGMTPDYVKRSHYEGVIETLLKLKEKGLVNV